MNYFFIAFTSLIVISTILYIVFYFNNIKLGAIITGCVQVPFLIGSSISILINALPDSIRIGTLLSITLLLGSAGIIFSQFEKKNFHTFSVISYCISLLSAILLIRSIFILYHIPTWTIICSILVLAAIFTAVIIISKKQKYYFYIAILIPYTLSVFFILCALFNLIAYKNLSSILLFSSSIWILLFNVFYTLNYTNFKLKNGKFINQLSLISIYSSLTAGFVLMLF